ncbi:MAG TPA: hypothetical protein VFI43_01850 [Nitrosospira sp.]|nr:hypothetical protein [Nitrosospira sp.]
MVVRLFVVERWAKKDERICRPAVLGAFCALSRFCQENGKKSCRSISSAQPFLLNEKFELELIYAYGLSSRGMKYKYEIWGVSKIEAGNFPISKGGRKI